MISPDEALAIVLDAAQPLPPSRLPLAQSLGLVLAEDLCADRDYPPFDRAMMDGFAVCLADAGGWPALAGELAAGSAVTTPVTPGHAFAIMTGAPCPPGTEAVVPVERAEVLAGGRVQLPESIKWDQNIARKGRECRRGICVAPAGSVVTPLVVANAATYGQEELLVYPQPRCAIIVTGAEISANAHPDAAIRDSNGPMIEALLRTLGIRPCVRTHAQDTAAAIGRALEAAGDGDIVILSGGVSAGKYDLVPDTLRAIGVEVLFHKVSQKPGKPLLFGTQAARLFFGLPGNPLSCHLGFHRYIRPAIRKRMGLQTLADDAVLSKQHEGGNRGSVPGACGSRGILQANVAGDASRTTFILCRVQRTPAGLAVAPLNGKGSADLHTPCLANAYLRIEAGETLNEGATVEFDWTLPQD